MIEQKFKRHIPNILTSIRLLLVPIFIFFLVSENYGSYTLSLIIFIIASITDYYDGKLARKYNVESKFGIFMDPLADKILVLSAFIGFLSIETLSNIIQPWMVIVIFSRDIFVTILRVFMKSRGQEMITSQIAKLKTTVQLITIIIILLLLVINPYYSISNNQAFIYLTIYMMVLFTLYTGLDYYLKNYKIISTQKSE